VVTLLHLNGPPGIGKSTISALWAERHPRTLNLDIDVLHPLIGGWRDPGQDTHALARPLGRAMASAYLATGHDVVLPQYLGRLDEVESFERVALDQGAHFREVVLLDERDAAIARFDARRDDTAWNQHNRRVVADLGGAAFLAEMYDRLLAIVGSRPAAVVVRSVPDAIEETYAAIEEALTSNAP
jgi:predicted kinase